MPSWAGGKINLVCGYDVKALAFPPSKCTLIISRHVNELLPAPLYQRQPQADGHPLETLKIRLREIAQPLDTKTPHISSHVLAAIRVSKVPVIAHVHRPQA